MKTYLIKNTDLMLNGKIFSEGSTIELDEKEANSLSDYLVTLSASSLAVSRDEVSPTNKKEFNVKNKRNK